MLTSSSNDLQRAQQSLTVTFTKVPQSTQKHTRRSRHSKLLLEPVEELPGRVVNGIKSFVLFIGHSRSGHSIVGSILDSHPHVVLSHEVGLLRKMVRNPEWDKKQIINELWQNDVSVAVSGPRMESAIEKGYTLAIPKLYQGTYESYIDVIGDKKGLETAALLATNSTLWRQIIHRLESVTGLPLKLFHVIRNPFDNIATLVFYNAIRAHNVSTNDVVELKQKGYNYSFDSYLIDQQIEKYFKLYQAAEDAKVKIGIDTIQIHSKDLIADPKKVIAQMCNFLQIICSNYFISVCSDKIFPKESKTRYQIHWSDYHIKEIQKGIAQFASLHRYAEFDS